MSNFNFRLLSELQQVANVMPHVVQNWAEPGNMDLEVREWCFVNDVAYQPYAALRNLHHLPQGVQSILRQIADERAGGSMHAVVNKLFLQSGAIIIPRSTTREHLIENLEDKGGHQWQLSPSELISLGWPMYMQDMHTEKAAKFRLQQQVQEQRIRLDGTLN